MMAMTIILNMKSDSSGISDLERVIGRAAVEAARMSSQASQAAKKILGDVSSEISEISEAKSYDLAPIDLIETDDELIALVALPGANKEKIDLRVTEDSFYVDAKVTVREGKYLRREMGTMGRKREIKLPIEIKPEQAKASFKDGILEVHLPKLVIINAQRVQVD
jgi:HSP20 family protein